MTSESRKSVVSAVIVSLLSISSPLVVETDNLAMITDCIFWLGQRRSPLVGPPVLYRMHQDAFMFALQMCCGRLRPRPALNAF